MKTNALRDHWMTIVPAVAAVVAYAYFFFLPGQQSIASLREELAAREQFIGQVAAFGPAIEATQQQLDKTDEYVLAWEQSAPSVDGLPELFGRINRLAKESGTTTRRFEPRAAIRYDKIWRLPVVVACVGSFGEISQFLQALERLEETIWVESLEMKASGEDGEDVQCEIALAIFADNPGDSDQVVRSE